MIDLVKESMIALENTLNTPHMATATVIDDKTTEYRYHSLRTFNEWVNDTGNIRNIQETDEAFYVELFSDDKKEIHIYKK